MTKKTKPVKGSRKGRDSHSAQVSAELRAEQQARKDGLCVCDEAPKPHAQHREALYMAEPPLMDNPRYSRLLKRLTPDSPLAPPAPGVEPATAFAERLARALCAGEPLPSMVIEILKAVRERDEAIVKAKDEEATTVGAAMRSR
jgi:hypothetical protein